ncbi:MAG TPA: hypothetical protein G4O18_03670 [Dehalococcoidia bacterium]|nr:hypothetical protein [Dehalococcoidia bacterium]
MKRDAQMINKEKSSDVKRCVRCVMPENYPGITLNPEGVCNFCRYFEGRWRSWSDNTEEQAKSKAKLERIFENAKRKGKRYDALLGISGGKDSSYCLYICKEVYGLNVLTCTRDNGFMSEEGKERVNKLIQIFDVPHLYYADPFSQELAGIFMRKTGNFCAPCELFSFNIHAMLAREYDIPLIVMGSSSRTDGAPPKKLNPWDPWYFRNVLKGESFKERLNCSFYANYIIKEGLTRLLGHRRMILLPDYLDWDEKQIARMFEEKYGIHFGHEHSDCLVDDLKDYLYARKCGGTSTRAVKYSLLIRTGRMSREEALEKLSEEDYSIPPASLDYFLEIVDMSREEFEAASEKSPEAYLSIISRIFNAIRLRIRKQAA